MKCLLHVHGKMEYLKANEGVKIQYFVHVKSKLHFSTEPPVSLETSACRLL